MRSWTDNIDPATIPDEVLKREWARRNSLKRKTYGAGTGRPRSNAPRCPCGEMTAKRAAARKHVCQAS
jgi:hypothetical protein